MYAIRSYYVGDQIEIALPDNVDIFMLISSYEFGVVKAPFVNKMHGAYQVIDIRFQYSRVHVTGQIIDLIGEKNIDVRITSYNVCYTKLLRSNNSHVRRISRCFINDSYNFV